MSFPGFSRPLERFIFWTLGEVHWVSRKIPLILVRARLAWVSATGFAGLAESSWDLLESNCGEILNHGEIFSNQVYQRRGAGLSLASYVLWLPYVVVGH